MSKKILYCKIGWMTSYKGINKDDQTIKNGGSYNKDHIGYEIYNFLETNNTYYGFVQAPFDSIEISKLTDDKKPGLDFVDDILVVFVATNTKGPVIIGWYNNAKVYRKLNNLSSENMFNRDLKDHTLYNLESSNATLLPVEKRDFKITGFGRADIWYGNETINEMVLNYITGIDTKRIEFLKDIEETTKNLVGKDKEIMIKGRVNQGLFRSMLLDKYHECNLCRINRPELLIASHIKPWTASKPEERLDNNNGLLLCAIHDRLFDAGLITFDSTGKIIISSRLDQLNRTFSNIKDDMKISITPEIEEYMKYHRENIFKEN